MLLLEFDSEDQVLLSAMSYTSHVPIPRQFQGTVLFQDNYAVSCSNINSEKSLGGVGGGGGDGGWVAGKGAGK